MTACGDTAETNAVIALNMLMLERVITHFATNFGGKRQPWSLLKVAVSVEAQDEFTKARVRRQVEVALAPFLRNVSVSVTGGQGARSVDHEDGEDTRRLDR